MIDTVEGGGIGSWDIRAVRHALTAVMRRRPEAYHQRLVDSAAPPTAASRILAAGIRGRIVNIGSVSGRISTPLLGPYSVSKFAMDTLSDTLRMELRPWHIHVAYVQPSGIATPIWSKALAEGDRIGQQLPDRAHTLYGSVIGQMRERATQAVHNGMPVRTVGKAVAHALTSSRPRTRYPIGSIAIVGEVLRILPDKWRNRLIMMQFK